MGIFKFFMPVLNLYLMPIIPVLIQHFFPFLFSKNGHTHVE